MLKRQGVIEAWHDRRIGAGQEFGRAIDKHANQDDIILLVSADFLASDCCYDIEMRRAMERHEAGEAAVIPVILRACDWHGAPFGKLTARPRDGKPVTQWPDIDEAFLQVAKAVRETASRLGGPARQARVPALLPQEHTTALGAGRQPRSSNLGLAKTFTQRDKDRFKIGAFEFMARYFENSLEELGQRNTGVEGVFRRVDANRFFATAYRNGKDVARGTIFMGDSSFGRGINYVQGETTASNTLNETLMIKQSILCRRAWHPWETSGRASCRLKVRPNSTGASLSARFKQHGRGAWSRLMGLSRRFRTLPADRAPDLAGSGQTALELWVWVSRHVSMSTCVCDGVMFDEFQHDACSMISPLSVRMVSLVACTLDKPTR